MAIKEKDQPARDKPNESENQPQFASEDEVPPDARRDRDDEDEPAPVSRQPGNLSPGPDDNRINEAANRELDREQRRAGGDGVPDRGRR